MTKRIKTSGVGARRIRSTSKPAALVDPRQVAEALGAEHVMSMPTSLSPPALLELRRRLFAVLKSRGGRPGLEGTELRPKIPMSLEDWHQLELLAKELVGEGFAPTAGQVGAQLLHAALVGIRNEAQPETRPYPLAGRAREPTATYSSYSTRPTTSPASPQEAARRYLQQAQGAGERHAVSDRRITKLSIQNLERLFMPPGLPVVDKGAQSPTTSIAILGNAGAGKTTLAVAIAHAIVVDAAGIALYLTTEVAPTEIKYKLSLLRVSANVVAWKARTAMQTGDIVGQHVSLLEGTDKTSSLPIRQRALEAAWQLVDATANEPSIRCVVIDAFPPTQPSNGSGRDDIVTLLQALEGRGVSVVIVQESAEIADFVPYVADVVFQLRLDEDPHTGQRIRTARCLKSRYACALASVALSES